MCARLVTVSSRSERAISSSFLNSNPIYAVTGIERVGSWSSAERMVGGRGPLPANQLHRLTTPRIQRTVAAPEPISTVMRSTRSGLGRIRPAARLKANALSSSNRSAGSPAARVLTSTKTMDWPSRAIRSISLRPIRTLDARTVHPRRARWAAATRSPKLPSRRRWAARDRGVRLPRR